MSRLLRSSLALVVMSLFLPTLVGAQCANGEEVCLQSTNSSGEAGSTTEFSGTQDADTQPSTTISATSDEVTTETYSDEQAELVANITRNLKRRRLTRPAGDNAFDQIKRLQEIHPLHDYSVNGTKYIARIMMVLGRRALRNKDLTLAEFRLQQAIKFDPNVSRQNELKQGISDLGGGQESTTAESEVLQPMGSVAPEPPTPVASPLISNAPDAASIEVESDPAELPIVNNAEVEPGLTAFKGEVTTETYTEEQAQLVAGITSDLKQRKLLEPLGNNAVEKIQRLKDIHPAHDYSVNGEKYVARILMVLGRKALREENLELASRHMLKALQFDPKVKRQDELKKAIAEAARSRESERETKALTEQTAALTSYLQGNSSNATQIGSSTGGDFIAPVMVAIPAGSFMMGSDDGSSDEKPVHKVVVEAFSMSKHEITSEQYRLFAVSTGRLVPQYLPTESNLPVTNVSWHDAVAYADWLSLKTRKLFRLPSESEWEYAARAGTSTEFFTGNSLVNAANCSGCGGQWAGKSVAPVGSFDPNEFGLYDTHGNVWEWVQDCWSNNYNDRTGTADAFETDDCQHRVLRGGSWYNDASRARVSYRGNERSHYRDNGVGFRVVYEGL